MTEITAQSIDEALKKQLEQLNVSVESREVGTVIQVGDGIARDDGLRDAMAGELLEFIGEGGKTCLLYTSQDPARPARRLHPHQQ